MIRFIDLTKDYWLDPEFSSPVCAFIDTVTDRFVKNDFNSHTFDALDDVESIKPEELRKRCLRLLPEGFFAKKKARKTKCPDSTDGQHSYSPDYEYDPTGQTINCEHCGESKS